MTVIMLLVNLAIFVSINNVLQLNRQCEISDKNEDPSSTNEDGHNKISDTMHFNKNFKYVSKETIHYSRLKADHITTLQCCMLHCTVSFSLSSSLFVGLKTPIYIHVITVVICTLICVYVS